MNELSSAVTKRAGFRVSESPPKSSFHYSLFAATTAAVLFAIGSSACLRAGFGELGNIHTTLYALGCSHHLRCLFSLNKILDHYPNMETVTLVTRES